MKEKIFVESTMNYKHWASKRIRDVAALQNWVTDPENISPPVKEKIVQVQRFVG